jgi:hypothetical protein
VGEDEGINKMKLKILVTLLISTTLATAQPAWQSSKEENPLFGKQFDLFRLEGRYLSQPSVSGGNVPLLRVYCAAGKFAKGEFLLGAVAQHSGTKSIKGAWQAQVDMRLDERKKTEDLWEYSNDQKTLFFDRIQLDHLLTGKLLGHPTKDVLTRRVILGVIEALGNEVVVQFNMPSDQKEIISACGLEWGRK